jgi:hypothetical protein
MSGLNLKDSEKHPENFIWKKVVLVINIVTLVISLSIFLSIDSRLKSEYSALYFLMFPHLIFSFLFFSLNMNGNSRKNLRIPQANTT